MRRILIIFLVIISLLTCKSKPQTIDEPEVIVEIIPVPGLEIIEPEFEIVSIVILQADIVVTEFETVLRVKNPNEFALELTSLTYELFGNGAYWAGGSGKDILHILPFDSSETKFTFSMNFINMSRRLLDDVIAMRQVRYRFTGEAEVQPVVPNVEPFKMKYDCSGLSEVRRRS